MRFDRMVIPSVREDNQVDELLKQISQIRNTCNHEFRIKNAIDLQESKIREVYIVGAEGHVYVISIICIKCGKEKQDSLSRVCPACLGNIKPDGRNTLRSKYYPNEACIYYRAVTGQCSQCGLQVVWDERSL